MRISKIIFITVGCICLGLGTVGMILPILPTVPFYMATAFCFAKSSEKLHRWFISSEMYKKHLQSFVEKRGMLFHKADHTHHGDAAYGFWLCYDEPCACGEGDTCGGMGLPYHILCVRRKDHKHRKIGKRHNNGKHSHIRGRLS